MYKEHPSFTRPKGNKLKIWRYMDFTKYLSLIETKTLHFARSDTLGDPFEGSYPEKNVKQREKSFTNFLNQLPSGPRMIVKEKTFNFSNIYQQIRYLIYISSWHENQYESAAMWKLYLQSNEGIAVQSTFGRFKDCFLPNTPEIYIGEVQYRDYSQEKIPEGNFYAPFLHKRKSFEHEKELRALVFNLPHTATGKSDLSKNTPKGLNIPVDLQKLIANIFISPESPEWFVKLVRSVNKTYKLATQVNQSGLDAKPLY